MGDAPEIGFSTVLAPAWTATNGMNGPPDAAQVGQALGVFKYVEDNSRRHIQVYLGADYVAPAKTAVPPTFAAAQTAQWQWLAANTTFPLMAPSYLPAEYSYAGSRIYDIDTEKGPKPALKVMYRYQREDQFLGLMQTTFVDAPAASPGEAVEQDGTTFTIVQPGPGSTTSGGRRTGRSTGCRTPRRTCSRERSCSGWRRRWRRWSERGRGCGCC